MRQPLFFLFSLHQSLFAAAAAVAKCSITCLPIEEFSKCERAYMEEKKKDIQKDTLKPITKVNSKLDKELQEWEVESTKDGGDLNQ